MDALVNYFSFEIISLIVGLFSVIVAMIRIWQKWSLKMAFHKEFVLQKIASMETKAQNNELMIKKNHDETSLSIEEIKMEIVKIVARIDGRIEKMEEIHDKAIRTLHLEFEKVVEKFHHENKEAHDRLFIKIDTLTEKVIDTCATFNEYKNHSTLNQRKTGSR